jgi:HEAT repeat protein
MRSVRLLASLFLATVVSSTSLSPVVEAAAPNTVNELVERLNASDFRVRVQAALILGKTAEPEALPALLRGLKDGSAAEWA